MFYELKDANSGEILESNMQEGGQISFITGHGTLQKSLKKKLAKLKSGDKATINIKAAEGCGEYNKDAIQSLPKRAICWYRPNMKVWELFGQK